jgi:hypothetical protein
MKTTIRIALLAIAVSFLVGCASVDITKTAAGYYAPTNPNDVEILMTVPTRPYVELGTVTVTGFAAKEEAKMHNAIRAKAAPLGATCVIIQSQGMIPKGYGQFDRWATGVAIRYKEAAPKH